MTGSNHVVAGALIAVVSPVAAVAIPAAFLSHFVLDMMPHYGDNDKHSWLNRHFNYVLGVDAAISLVFLVGVAVWQPANWALLIVCGLIAVLPDVVWVPYYIADLRKQERPLSAFARFSKWIQWGERPWGIYIEAVVLVGLLAVFSNVVQ